jgi:HEAT repeat protein
LKCFFYGFVFACGLTVILTTLVAFRVSKKHPTKDITHLSGFLIWPLMFIIFILYIFPLVDFVYMAYSEKNKGLTPFQEFFAEKLIHPRKAQWQRYLVAISLWVGLFILPPLLLGLIDISLFFIPVMGWSFIYPILIIAYLGNRGYVTGVVRNTYIHHTMERALHLSFDKSPRIFGVIFHRFFSTVMLIIQIVTYVVMFVVLILFSVYFFSGSIHQVKGTNFQTFAISLSFLFGIIGYFNKFWKKKIKFRWIDVFLSSWLIAAVGINIVTNFMILRLHDGLDTIFNTWTVTKIITGTIPISGGNHVLFIPVALIEEIMFIILVNYYLFSKNSKFFLEARLNLMEFAASNFMPIPLFNFVHHANPQLRRAAKHELIQMYNRLPVRNDIKFAHKRYMNPLFDSLSDPNKYNREVAKEILVNLIQNHPDKISPQINQVLESGNFDAQVNLGLIIVQNPGFLSCIPSKQLVQFFNHPNFKLKRIGAELIVNLPKQPPSLSNESILKGLSNPDHIYQSKCMEIATKFGILKDINLLLKTVKASKSHLQQIAIQSFVGLLNQKDIKLTNKEVNSIIGELNSGNTSTREAAIISIAKLDNLKQYKIPFEPLLLGIKSQIQSVRESSERVLRQLIPNMKKNDLSQLFNTILSLTEAADDETIHHILPLLAANWRYYPQKVVSMLVRYIKNPDKQIQHAVEDAFCDIAQENPQIVLNSLMPIKDERTYLTKSVIQKIFYRICSHDPTIIKLLEEYVKQSNITIKKNTLAAMEDLSKDYGSHFDPYLLINEIKGESFAEIRLKLISVLSKILQNSEVIEKAVVNELLPLLESEDRDLRKQLSNLFEEIAKNKPSLISMDTLKQLSIDENPSIRESCAKILRYYVNTQKESSIELLNILIEDDKWIVQSAVIDTLMQSKWELEPDLIGKIINMLDQPDEWLSRKVLEFIQYIGKKEPDHIPIAKIQYLTTHANPHIRSMVLKIIELLGFEVGWDLIVKLMQDEDSQVREQATRSLVSISKNMSITTLFSYTLKYFRDDTDILLQRSIARALQRIVKYESAEIKNRLIGILKIRCQLSQDPILCQIWHELDNK